MGEKGCARAVHVSALARHSQPALAYGPRPLTRYLETGRIAVNTEPAALAAN